MSGIRRVVVTYFINLADVFGVRFFLGEFMSTEYNPNFALKFKHKKIHMEVFYVFPQSKRWCTLHYDKFCFLKMCTH